MAARSIPSSVASSLASRQGLVDFIVGTDGNRPSSAVFGVPKECEPVASVETDDTDLITVAGQVLVTPSTGNFASDQLVEDLFELVACFLIQLAVALSEARCRFPELLDRGDGWHFFVLGRWLVVVLFQGCDQVGAVGEPTVGNVGRRGNTIGNEHRPA